MSIVFEIVIYIVLVLGIIITTIAFCDNSLNKTERYIRLKKEGATIKVKVEIDGIDDRDKELISDVIAKGKFENIYDIVDEYIAN
jgi:hypothetical protein